MGLMKDRIALALAKRLPPSVRYWCAILIIGNFGVNNAGESLDDFTINDLLRFMDTP